MSKRCESLALQCSICRPGDRISNLQFQAATSHILTVRRVTLRLKLRSEKSGVLWRMIRLCEPGTLYLSNHTNAEPP